MKNDSGLSGQSAHSYAYAVRMALRKALRENVILEDPSVGIKGISFPESDLDFLTSEELQKLSKVKIKGTLGAEVKRAFIFACYSALRVSDIRSLEWHVIEHMSTGAQIILSGRSKQKRGCPFRSMKARGL